MWHWGCFYHLLLCKGAWRLGEVSRCWELGAHSLRSLMSVLLVLHSSLPADTSQTPQAQARSSNQKWQPGLACVLYSFWQATRKGHLVLFNRPVARSRRGDFHQWGGGGGKQVLLFCKTIEVGKGIFLHESFRKLYGKFRARDSAFCQKPSRGMLLDVPARITPC